MTNPNALTALATLATVAARVIRYTLSRRAVRLIPLVSRTTYPDTHPNGLTAYTAAMRGDIVDAYRVEVRVRMHSSSLTPRRGGVWDEVGRIDETARGNFDAIDHRGRTCGNERPSRKDAARRVVERWVG